MTEDTYSDANREFVFDVTGQKQAEEALKEQSRILNERNKELRCLYTISRLVEDQDNSIDDILQGTVNILPYSWQYPEVACARVKFEDRTYVTGNFRETSWRQAQGIIAEKELAGCVEIFYLEEKPQIHEGPFIREERDLIDAVAERLGRIIERVRAQIRLQQSEQKFRDIFNGSNDAVFIQEISGRFLEVNQVACSRLGYSREEFLHMTPMDLDTHEYAGSGPQRIQDVDNQGSLTFESVHRCKDGSTIDVEISSRKINYEGKSCILSIARDITKRKQAEEELKENEKRFRLLVESAPEAIFIQTEGFFAYLNPAAVHLFGADSPEDLLGKPVMDRFHPDYHKVVKERIRMLNQEKKTVQNLKEKYLQMDGSFVDVEVSAVPFNYRGKDGALVFVRDITEQKRADQKHKDLENQLQLSQRMEAVGRLAGGVAHDFNNLLSIILGYGEILLQNMEKDQAGYEPLTQIYDAGIRAKNLTRQLLAFGRKQVLEMQRADINEVISGFNKLIRRVIGEDVDLQLHLNEDPFWVVADTSQIEQILMNLAVNARDAMPEGGTLTIETAAVELDDIYASEKPGVTAGNYAMIAVSDTGIGMDQKTRDSVFEPFFTTKEKDKGTGLGLSTCYGIAKQHRGNIWVYSEPGAGTTFKIYLPLDATQEGEKEKLVIEKDVGPDGTETILVVEDDTAVRQLTCTVLKQNGYNVLESEDVYNAVEISRSHKAPIHLMIVDVIMPGMKGPEVYRNVAAHHPEIKVLYMSGYTDNVIAHHGILEEGFQFIQKPFSIKALATKIREVLDQ